MSDENHHRKADGELVRLATMLEGLVARYDRDREDDKEEKREERKTTETWRKGYTERQTAFQVQLDAFREAIAPFIIVGRALKWAFVISGGALLTGGVKLGFDWIANHWK